MKAFVVATALLAIATVGQATTIKCKDGTTGTEKTCAAGETLCMMTTTYSDNTWATASSTTYACAASSVTTKPECAADSTAKTNKCYCTGSATTPCQDVTQCLCTATGGKAATKYANAAENTAATAEPESAAPSSARIAGMSMAAAAAAWWLL